jgi:4-amino-4-deoxy-L-arabinose transferase-like glycosyltransferase
MRLLVPERSFDALGPHAILDAFFAISLAGLILYSAQGLGRFLFRLIGIGGSDPLLALVLSLTLGLGVLAYGVLALGLAEWLAPPTVFLWVAVAGGVALHETVVYGDGWGDPWQPFRSLHRALKVSLAVAFTIFAMSLIQALVPVWDYDGLMYHLQAPDLFLRSGKLMLLPDLWQANGPLLTEMLYLVGLAAESSVFSKVIHLSLAIILLLSTFAVARRHLGDRAGWLAGGILLGVPIFPVWGSLAYADMGWALFEFLAVAAFLEWRRSPGWRWIVVSGILAGFAMGSKYTGLTLFPILLLAFLVERSAGTFSTRLRIGVVFGGAALLVAAPWYLKNLLWAGNPIYPFIIGGPEWSAERLAMLMTYLRSFCVSKSLVDTMLLPLHLFTQRAAFGSFMSRIDVPSLLFLLALGFPFLKRSHPLRPLGWMALLRFLLWAAGTQQTRFLLPLYPVLSLMAASVLDAWLARREHARWDRTIAAGLVAGLVGVTLAYQVIYFIESRPIPVVLGIESKHSFLERSVYDYPTLRYIRASLQPTDRVYMAWDGQSYYCDSRCLPDAEQSQWAQLALESATVDAMATQLEQWSVTHFLLDVEGLNFMLQHDPNGSHAAAAEIFFRSFEPVCLSEVRHDEKVVLYAFTCG